MSSIFVTKGRLGNAIFRYLGCSLFSSKYNLSYLTQEPIDRGKHSVIILDDNLFNKFIKYDNAGITLDIPEATIYRFVGFYQHDTIYKKYKTEIMKYINKYKNEHYVMTDGINAGDGRVEKFYLKDIVDTPDNFDKYYDFALHIRLGDQVKYKAAICIDDIKNIVDKINIPSNSCIVINTPKTDFEKKFLNNVTKYINTKKNINIAIESNDIITDFHIMKNVKTLVCSISTISWCAAYFSDKIIKCYMPDYAKGVNSCSSCKRPIDNTELYNYTYYQSFVSISGNTSVQNNEEGLQLCKWNDVKGVWEEEKKL